MDIKSKHSTLSLELTFDDETDDEEAEAKEEETVKESPLDLPSSNALLAADVLYDTSSVRRLVKLT